MWGGGARAWLGLKQEQREPPFPAGPPPLKGPPGQSSGHGPRTTPRLAAPLESAEWPPGSLSQPLWPAPPFPAHVPGSLPAASCGHLGRMGWTVDALLHPQHEPGACHQADTEAERETMSGLRAPHAGGHLTARKQVPSLPLGPVLTCKVPAPPPDLQGVSANMAGEGEGAWGRRGHPASRSDPNSPDLGKRVPGEARARLRTSRGFSKSRRR